MVHGRVYRTLNIIGQGGEATVYRCVDAAGSEYAVKVFYFSRFPPNQLAQRIESFDKEARILKYLSGRSRHFVWLTDYQYRKDENIGYMVMELGEGSLRQYLRGYPLDDATRRVFWKQIVAILRALEDAQIGQRERLVLTVNRAPFVAVHADIKPDNMIMVNNVLKVTDLGLAFKLAPDRQSIQRPFVRGTLGIMSHVSSQ